MNETVPYLDLAPRLKRPLKIWNLLDYMRLLYWVFFFPQALRWYVETFVSTEYRNAKGKDLQAAFMQDTALRHLILQAALLVLFTPFALARSMALAGLTIDWSGVALGMAMGVALGVTTGVAFGVATGVATGVNGGVATGVATGVALGVATGMVTGVTLDVASGVATGLATGVLLGTTRSMALGVNGGVAFGVTRSMAFSAALGVATGVALGVAFGVATGVAFSVAFGVAVAAAILRPEMWAMGALYLSFFDLPGHATKCTPLPLPRLEHRLKEWLRADWPTGMHNLNELMAYSLQFIPVVQALNDALAEHPPARLLASVDEIAKDPYDWDLLCFASVPLVNKLIERSIEGVLFLPMMWKRRLKARYPIDLRMDTLPRAACAGFWYLHEKQPLKASEAFSVVRSLPNGEEMYRLSQALLQAQGAEDLHTLADLAKQTTFQGATTRPSETALILHPTTWQALEHLQRATLEAYAVQESVSQAARSRALNRAMGEVVSVQEMIGTLPKAERALVEVIAANWQKVLLSVAGEVGKVIVLEPVENPYVVGDPVVGTGFVGREDTIRRLEALWCGTTSPPSVVLFGHRRMGKTSILRNIDTRLGSEIYLAYINLLTLGEARGGVSDLLLAMADKIRVALPGLPQLEEASFDRHPYRAFEQFLVLVRAALGSSRLIIALDEFEQLEEWMRTGQVPRDLLKVLRGYMQMDEHIAFAFAGLHTLEEMTSDYFEPFFASVITIRVSFLSHEATFQVLANPPVEDFPLDYSREALERIWQLTGGQPYLVQLIGHHLVSRFNRVTFEQGSPAELEFTLADVEAAIGDPEFYSQGRYYFAGVWGQAGQGAAGQQKVLKLLSAFPMGLSLNEFMAYFGPDLPELKEALDELQRHDVLREKDGRWWYAVELMLRWVKDFR